MSADPSQVSATISAATKEKPDRFTESHGLKKNFVVEQALLFFMEARREHKAALTSFPQRQRVAV